MEASKILSGAYEEKEIAVSKLNSVLLGRILNELWEYGTTRKNIRRYYTPKHLIRYIYFKRQQRETTAGNVF